MQDEDSIMGDLEKEIELMRSAIARNEGKLEEMKVQEALSTQKIAEADTLFNAKGEAFVAAKQACEMIEELKDMLTEKTEVINEIILRKFQLENTIGQSIKALKIAHIADLFKESGEIQMAYAVTQNQSAEIDRIIKDSSKKAERKVFRERNQ